MYFLRRSLFFLFICFVVSAAAQNFNEFGRPFITNYLPSAYDGHPQNWAIAQDTNGLIYIANNQNLICYDGVKWKYIPLPFQDPILSIAVAENGKIYLGSVNEFGYMDYDSFGKLKYHSLLDYFNEFDPNFMDVRRIAVSKNRVLFTAFSKCFLYGDSVSRKWDAKTNFRNGFSVNGDFFINQDGIGLMKIIGDSLQLIPNGGFFADKSVFFLLPIGKRGMIAGTRYDGLFLIEQENKSFSSVTIKEFKNDATRYIEQFNLYHGIKLSNGLFALATDFGGVLIMDETGKIRQIINKNSGLANETINSLAEDKDQNLWIALDVGLANVEISSSLTRFSEGEGLTGIVLATKRFGGDLYVGTGQGLFHLVTQPELKNNERPYHCFEQVKGLRDACLDLEEINGELIIASTDGLYSLKGGKAVKKVYCNVARQILQSCYDSNYVYVNTNLGITLLEIKENKWKSVGIIRSIQPEGTEIYEDKFGNIWYASTDRKVIRLHHTNKIPDINPEMCLLDSTYGLSNNGRFSVSMVGDQIILPSDTTIYTYDVGSDSKNKVWFSVDNKYPLKDENNELVAYVNMRLISNNEILINSGTGIAILRNEGNHYIHWTVPFERLSKTSYFSIETDKYADNVLFGGSNGLYIYNPNQVYDYYTKPKILIRKISFGKDSLFYDGTGKFPSSTARIKYDLNSIDIEYSLISYRNETENEYCYKIVGLSGYQGQWSNWSKDAKATVTNIPNGDFTFMVKGRNIYGIESDGLSFSITIDPPWHRTILAYIGYTILGILIVILFVKLYTRRIENQKRELENIVLQRTLEITEKNEYLAIQKNEIEKQKEEIEDSIRYAKRIQTAVLPTDKLVASILGEHFILFRPKDVVSGDFYWSTQVSDWIIVTAADCTGHGVPGAFMSMLGVSFLNEIVRKKEVTDAAEVLNHLRNYVIEALNQSDKADSQKDGMDMSLIAIHKDKKKALWAGANNPLWIIRDSVVKQDDVDSDQIIEEVRPDKMPVAVYVNMEQFSNHYISLEPGDKLYLFTDGFPDQFGGAKGKKFKYKPFKRLLVDNRDKSMAEQKKILEDTLDEWTNYIDPNTGENHEQVDDITIVGIKI